MRAGLQSLLLPPPCVPHERSSACACLNEPSPCLHLFRQRGRNQQAGTDKILSKNDISRNSCRLWHWEERRERKRREREKEREAEGGEQLTRSDTGKRGDLIAQLAKSTGRKQQERLVPSVWPGSLLLLVGPSAAFLSSLSPPPPSLLPVLLLPALLPVTAHYIGTK